MNISICVVFIIIIVGIGYRIVTSIRDDCPYCGNTLNKEDKENKCCRCCSGYITHL